MSDLNIATSLRCDASGCDVRYIARCLPPTLALHYRPSHRLLVDQSDNRSFARFPSTTSKVMTLLVGWFCSQSVLFGSISDIARCIAHRIDDCDGTVTSHRSMRFGTDIAIATCGNNEQLQSYFPTVQHDTSHVLSSVRCDSYSLLLRPYKALLDFPSSVAIDPALLAAWQPQSSVRLCSHLAHRAWKEE